MCADLHMAFNDKFLLLLFQGAAHAVDSSELAFRLAAIGAVKQGISLSNNT